MKKDSSKTKYVAPDSWECHWRLWRSLFRVEVFIGRQGPVSFSRKAYMHAFVGMSTATASRDLRGATATGLLEKTGDLAVTLYKAKGVEFEKKGDVWVKVS